mmetsp:Transcript_1511/g.1467  ORF Transcript_1511/g.1467 Transcript_1511/m.1467 type:complete len:580 (-) Transcript_1511:76-1815(-)
MYEDSKQTNVSSLEEPTQEQPKSEEREEGIRRNPLTENNTNEIIDQNQGEPLQNQDHNKDKKAEVPKERKDSLKLRGEIKNEASTFLVDYNFDNMYSNNKYSTNFLQLFNFKRNVATIFTLTAEEEEQNTANLKVKSINANRFKLSELNLVKGFLFLATLSNIIQFSYDGYNRFLIRNRAALEDNKDNFFWYTFVFSNMGPQMFYICMGFLLGYVTLYNTQHREYSFKFLLTEFLMRIVRIVPIMWFAVFLYMKLFPYLFDGPLSGYYYKERINSCSDRTAWAGVMCLYSGFLPQSGMCFPQIMIWQGELFLFILGGLLMLFIIQTNLLKHRPLVYIMFFLLIAVAHVIKALVLLNMDLGENTKFADLYTNSEYRSNYYMKPYLVFSDYLIGMVVGMLFYDYINGKQIEKELEKGGSFDSGHLRPGKKNIFNTIERSHTASVLSMLAGIGFIFLGQWMYYVLPTDMSENTYIALITVKDTFFDIGLILYLLPLLVGKYYFFGGWLKENFFVYMSKLSFVAMLVAPFAIDLIILNFRTALYFATFYVIVWTASFTVLAYVGGMVIGGAFDVPFAKIVKMI